MDQNNQVHQIAPGLTRTLLDNNTISVYTFYDNRRETIDAWFHKLLSSHDEWNAQRPYLIIHDLSRTFFTPYFRKRVRDIVNFSRADLRGAYAVVLPNSLAGHLMGLFLRRDLPAPVYVARAGVFHKFDEALEWLRQMRSDFAQS